MILNHDKQKWCRSEQRKEDPDAKRERLAEKDTSCEVCNNPGVEHHEDYSKPFETRFLCGRHHRRYHAATDSLPYRESQLDEFIQSERLKADEVLVPSANHFFTTLSKTVELEHADINSTVSLYYDIQSLLLADANRYRPDEDEEVPKSYFKKKPKASGGTSTTKIKGSPLHEFFERWMTAGMDAIEKRLKEWALSDDAPPETKWAVKQVGVGPLLAAALAGHIDVTKANHRSSLWMYAGYAPGTASRSNKSGKFIDVRLDKLTPGVPAPFNQRLRTLCYKIAACIVKAGDKEVKGKAEPRYVRLYRTIKAEETLRNDRGGYRQAAERELSTKKITNSTVRKELESGRLTKGHIESRTKRRLMKEFLADYWVEGREGRGLPTGSPYPVGMLGHDDRDAA